MSAVVNERFRPLDEGGGWGACPAPQFSGASAKFFLLSVCEKVLLSAKPFYCLRGFRGREGSTGFNFQIFWCVCEKILAPHHC